MYLNAMVGLGEGDRVAVGRLANRLGVTNVSAPFLDWTDAVINGPFANWLRLLPDLVAAPAWIRSLLADGIVAGVGGVLVFVPGLLILYFFLSDLPGRPAAGIWVDRC